jgi:hypothetical protein
MPANLRLRGQNIALVQQPVAHVGDWLAANPCDVGDGPKRCVEKICLGEIDEQHLIACASQPLGSRSAASSGLTLDMEKEGSDFDVAVAVGVDVVDAGLAQLGGQTGSNVRSEKDDWLGSPDGSSDDVIGRSMGQVTAKELDPELTAPCLGLEPQPAIEPAILAVTSIRN